MTDVMSAKDLPSKAALLSVSDTTGLVSFARALHELRYALLATTGTGRVLKEAGLPVISIEDYTAQPELFGGRVKTLHPRIYAGILARRDREEDMAELARCGIVPIDVVVVNLYPFAARSTKPVEPQPELSEMIELIDVGGPSMIRAAAKNHAAVLPLMDPADYPRALELIQAWQAQGRWHAEESKFERQRLACKVFQNLVADTAEIWSYLSHRSEKHSNGDGEKFSAHVVERRKLEGPSSAYILERAQKLRYGENPHQQACFYRELSGTENQREFSWRQLSGKELSYNNLLDCDAAARVLADMAEFSPACAIIKHLTPCGVASGENLEQALQRAKKSDPRSHFGGIIAFSAQVDEGVARNVREDFAEIVLAPSYSREALAILTQSKNLRVIEVAISSSSVLELRSAFGGILVQDADGTISNSSQWEQMTGNRLPPQQMKDLEMAWRICRHVRSNAIVLVRDGMLIGVGGGQTSRVDAVEVALMKAATHGHAIAGCVAASDAFFPFPDSVEILAARGVHAIVAPKGAKRDGEAVAAAEKARVALFFAEDRHFRH